MGKDKIQFKPLNTKRAFEKISDQIKNLILTKVLKPGDKLPPEREIASQFRTGRMVVREALRILEQSDLIYIKQGSDGGVFVKELDTMHVAKSFSDAIQRSNMGVDDLIEVRIGVEKEVVAHAIQRMDEGEIELLLENINKSNDMIFTQPKAAEQLIDFHLLLARGTKNQLYEMIVESLMTITHSYTEKLPKDPLPLKEHINKHREIYDIVKRRNIEEAQQKIEEHTRQIGIWFADAAKLRDSETSSQ